MENEETTFDGEVELETLTGQELMDMDTAVLDDVFSRSTAPEADGLSGNFRGSVLAGALRGYLPDPVKGVLKTLSGSPVFPWKGKYFEPGDNPGELQGKNLLFSLDTPVKMFDFTTRIEASEFDSADCLVLDYDHAKNPPGIRQVRDELRKVNSFLYLGRANLVFGGNTTFALYFCLEPEF